MVCMQGFEKLKVAAQPKLPQQPYNYLEQVTPNAVCSVLVDPTSKPSNDCCSQLNPDGMLWALSEHIAHDACKC